MIDLHCHIVPGVDDGPMDMDESLRLARALVHAGVSTIACTSHIRPDKEWMNTIVDDVARRSTLLQALSDHAIGLSCVRGAEHYVSAEVFGDLSDLDKIVVPYGASRWLLVETPYHGPPMDLLGLLYGIRRKGYKVLLAHAERFPYLCDDDDLLEKLRNAGHLIQVNLGSLAGAYNRAQQKAAEKLVKKGYCAVLAGDCHREKDVEDNIVKGRKALAKLVSDGEAERMLRTAPRAILDDAAPDVVQP